jgi:hypothetical protein
MLISMNACKYKCIKIHIHCIHIYICFQSKGFQHNLYSYICIHEYINAQIFVYIDINITYIYISIHIYIFIYMYVYTYDNVYI